MKFPKQGIFIIFAIAFQLKVHAQDKNACDSLVGRSFDFLADKADEIFLGKIIQAQNWKEASHYVAQPLAAYKGKVKNLNFTQQQNPQFFDFPKDSEFVFILFKNYRDKIFSSCFLFGNAKNMTQVTEIAKNKCVVKMADKDCMCTSIFSPVCGCDGILYGNSCDATCAGIQSWIIGDCPPH